MAKDLRATALLSLQSDADLASRGLTWSTLWAMHTREGLRAERVPIVDFDPRDLTRHLAAAVERAEALLAGGHRLYLHCTAGLNRSATVAVAVRARMLGALSEALAELADIHPTAVVADKALHRWAKKHL